MGVISMAAVAQEVAPVISVPAALHRGLSADFDTYIGVYELSNGQTLALTTHWTRMYATLDSGKKIEIVSTGKNSYVALNRQLKMTIGRRDDGEVKGELWLAQPANMADLNDGHTVFTKVMLAQQ
ncbi:hypothetical protein H7U20_01265 [Rugamonas sp. CCM 8940]|nr:hypothetical protein [Rugamonas sp. CCM 8940]